MKSPTLSLALIVLGCISRVQAQNLTEALASSPELSNFTTYLAPYTGQLAGLTNITLLAPNNNAFAEFLNSSSASALTREPNLVQAILSYHILNGTHESFSNVSFVPSSLQPGAYANVTGGQRVELIGNAPTTTVFSGLLQNATITSSSKFTGGVIHIIDRFLTLPQNMSSTSVALNLTSFIGLTTSLNLAQTIDNTGDLTYFVPNNAAFQRVGNNLIYLLGTDLASLLQYHVIPNALLYSTSLANGSTFSALTGTNLSISLIGAGVYVNNARVVLPNVLTRNGVLHVIDRVLDPSNSTASPGSDAFPLVGSASDVPFTSGIATPTSAIATQMFTSIATSGSGSASSAPSNSGSKSNTGAVAGGVVGGVLGLALIVFLVWFLRRKRSRSQLDKKQQNATITGSSVGRTGTIKSYHKPELEDPTSPAPAMSETNTTKPYRKPELEASLLSPNKSTSPAAAINEIDTPASRTRTELSGSTLPQGELATQETQVQQQQQHQQQTPGLTPAQQQEQERLREQEAQEARIAELANQRRIAEIEHQKRMAQLDHEQRMAELDISAARLRSQSRTLSELEARANPGPGSPD